MKKDNSGRNIAIISIVVIIGIIIVASIMHTVDLNKLSAYKEAEIFRIDTYNNEPADHGMVVSIDVNKFLEIRDSDRVSIIYYGTPTCPACIRYEPILEEVAEAYNLHIFYINLSEWSQQNARAATRILNNFEGTPTTMIMFNGRQVSAITGLMEKSALVEYLTEHNLIRYELIDEEEENEES